MASLVPKLIIPSPKDALLNAAAINYLGMRRWKGGVAPLTLDDEKTAACVTAGTIGGDISMLKALYTDQRLPVPPLFNTSLNSFLSGTT